MSELTDEERQSYDNEVKLSTKAMIERGNDDWYPDEWLCWVLYGPPAGALCSNTLNDGVAANAQRKRKSISDESSDKTDEVHLIKSKSVRMNQMKNSTQQSTTVTNTSNMLTLKIELPN